MAKWIGAFVILAVPAAAQKVPKLATQEQEGVMMGRIGHAIEDSDWGAFAGICKDVEKRQYSPRIRWGAHLWYGKALLRAKDRSKAIKFLQMAKKDAELLSENERKTTEDVLQEAGEK